MQIKQELRRKMHEPVAHVGQWLKRVVDGYYRYHAVPGNLASVGPFPRPALPLLAACFAVAVSGGARLGTTAADL